MGGFRAERIAEMIHRELAERLPEVKDPELAPVSITRVEVTRDLRVAKVSFLPFGGGETPKSLSEALERAGRRLRGPIGRALRLHHSPEIRFVADRHTEAALRVSKLLSELQQNREEGEE